MVVCPLCGNESKWLVVSQAARVLGRSEQDVRRACREGEMPGAQKVTGLGDKGHWRIPSAVVSILAQRKGGTIDPSDATGG